MKTPDIQLKEILRSAQWTQDELARQMGLPLKTINSWVTKRNYPRRQHLELINQFYLNIVGRSSVDQKYLKTVKNHALTTFLDLRNLLENEELLDYTTLHLTYNTNAIEGSTMTMEDVATVLESRNAIIANKTYREQAEARNHRAVFLFLLEQLRLEGENFRWSSALILETHKRLMNGIMDDAGKYRRYQVRIIGSKVARPDYLLVPEKIEELIEYMNQETSDPIEKLAKTHAIFELIHPFGDGNGRTGRLIMFIQAMQYGVVPPLLLKERKYAYYKYLEEADRTGDYGLLAMFIAESIISTDKLLG